MVGIHTDSDTVSNFEFEIVFIPMLLFSMYPMPRRLRYTAFEHPAKVIKSFEEK